MRAAVFALFAALLGCGGDPVGDPADSGRGREDAGDAVIDGGDAAGSLTLSLTDSAAVTVAALGVSEAGEIYVGGWFAGAITIAGAPLESAGGEDGFLLALDVGGEVRWLSTFGGPGDDRLTALTAADGMRVYVTGSVSGTVDLGGGPIGGRSEEQIVAASFDASGAHRWSRVFGPGAGTGIATNATGNVDVTGTLGGEADFGGGAVGTSDGGDGFVASLDAAGGHRWSIALGGDGESAIDAIANDLSCNVYVTGTSTGAIDLDGACAAGGAIIASWDQYGAFRWARCLPGGARTTSLAVTGTGRIALAGAIAGTADLGETVTSAGARDALVLGLDRNGADRFAAAFGGGGDDEARAVALDSIGRPYVAGARADEGAFVVLWDAPDPPARAVPAGLGDEALAVAIDPSGRVVVVVRAGADVTLHRM